MTPEEIKASIRDAVNHMVKAEPEDQEAANLLIRKVIQTKAQNLVSPPEATPEPDLTADPDGRVEPTLEAEPTEPAAE